VAQDPPNQISVAADTARFASILDGGLASIVHLVVRLERVLVCTLGDVGHLGAVREIACCRALHVLARLGLVNTETVRNITSRDHLLFV